ncbi:MAG: 50S ribosomal protein L23 [Firmicutes bacterium]|nr:50S ribosomal protein L23 [Bacillota bacterium]
MDLHDVIKKPVVTEKSNLLIADENKYTFMVDKRATKPQIKEAVEKIFKVKVVDVKTANMTGKKVRRGLVIGKKSDWKKAVVTLADGDRIDIFEGM